MTTANDIYLFMNKLYPFETQMGFDNSGFLVGDKNQPVNKALIALDITRMVADEAAKKGADLIISHHPVIWNKMKKITSDDIPFHLIKNGISAICAHTNLDMGTRGVNDTLAKKIGLRDIFTAVTEYEKPYEKITVFVPCGYSERVRNAMTLAGAGTLGNYSGCSFSAQGTGRFIPGRDADPFIGGSNTSEAVPEERIEMICHPHYLNHVIGAMINAHPYETPAYDIFTDKAVYDRADILRAGNLEKAMTARDLAVHVKSSLNAPCVKYTCARKMIKTVAVCGGSGGNYWRDAKALGADALLTGECKYNEMLDAEACGFTLLTAGHFETENPVVSVLSEILSKKFPNIEFSVSSEGKSPVSAI